MEIVSVERKDGTTEEVKVYNSLDFPYASINPITQSSKKGKDKKIGYMLEFGTFDIESSTIPGTPKLNEEGEKCGWKKLPKAFMYHWQACLAGVCVAGRYWWQFFSFIDKVCKQFNLGAKENGSEKRLVFFVHNLGFELSFMYPFMEKHFGGYEIFASDSHHPIKINCANGIEFRCSYKLTNMKLYMFTKTELYCDYVKPWDDLDYKQLRTPESELTQKEKAYCVIDVLGLWSAIKSKMKADKDSILTIPLTSTGYPRRICRKACREYAGYREEYFKKLRISYKVYKLLKEMKRGGDTHACRWRAGRILKSLDGADYVSEYPAQILLQDFPMGPFQYYGGVDSEGELEELLKTHACLFRIRIWNLRLKEGVAMPYVPLEKIWERSGPFECDNGRLLNNKDGMIALTVNEIDYQIIKEQYDFDYVAISDLYVAQKGPLPEPIRETVKQFFAGKCKIKRQIKEIEDKLEKDPDNAELITKHNELKYLYDRQKNLLNGIFGMMFTDPCQMETRMDEEGHWTEHNLKEGETEETLLDKYYKSRNSFLQYQWGCWVPAYGRLMLHKLRKCAVSEDGEEFAAYGDTDSVKSQVWNMDKVKELNDSIIALNEERNAYYVHEDGTKEFIGVAEFDSHYDEFITMGAKKYAYTDKDGLHVTVAGVSAYPLPGHKLGPGAEELMEHGGIKAFRLGFKFVKAGGVEVTYVHQDPHYAKVRGVVVETASYAAISDSVYTLGMTRDYKKLTGYV